MTLEGARPGGSASPLDLYRSTWAAGCAAMDRRWVRPAVGAAFIAIWLLLRMVGPVPFADVLWAAAAIVLSVFSPSAGLIVLAGVAPWDEPLTLGHALGLRSLLVLALGLSVAVRVAIRPRTLPRSLPVATALALLAISLVLGVGQVYLQDGRAVGWDTATFWLAGFGGAMIVVLVAIHLGAEGHRTALGAAVIAGAAAGLISLADYALPGLLRGLPIQGLLADKTFGTRLSGAIASPNAMVSLLVAPAAVLAAAFVRAKDRRLRIAALVALVPLMAALLLTYSRSAIIVFFVMAVILAWRWRRKVGMALLALGLVAGAAVTPAYLQARGNVIGGDSQVTPGSVLIATDVERITAWSAASRMWLDQPLTGFGFRSYKYLGTTYGDTILGSPHNEWIRLFAEEGIIAGIAGLAFILAFARALARGRDWLTIGVFGGFLGWAITASFNNPFLFVQVNVVVFTIAGVALGLAGRGGAEPGSTDAGTASGGATGPESAPGVA